MEFAERLASFTKNRPKPNINTDKSDARYVDALPPDLSASPDKLE